MRSSNRSTYLEIIGNVVIFGPGSAITALYSAGSCSLSLIARRGLGVVRFVEGVALRSRLILGGSSHSEDGQEVTDSAKRRSSVWLRKKKSV